MKPTEIQPEEMGILAVALADRGLAMGYISETTIAITRDSMVAAFPNVGEEYYAETVKVLRTLVPRVHWMAQGKTDDAGFFEAYGRPA